jgi:hypothetical protein
MPKGLYEIKDFAGGLNAYADPRDIDDSEFSQNWNVIVDKNGILRIVGSAVESINATTISNTNFQKGYGLFQFTTDYSLGSPNFDGSFEYGYEVGKVDSIPVNDPVTSTTIFVLEDTSTASSSNDFYNGMFVYFYSAANALGQTRVISDYVGSSRTVTLESAVTGGAITTNDKYMIFRWESDNWEITDSKKDFVVTQRTTGEDTFQGIDGSNFIATKGTATDEKSVNLGNVTFTPNGNVTSPTPADYLTLTPGIEYTLSFDCAALDRWYNLVSNGVTTGIEDTSINVDEGSGYTAGHTSVININGTLGADATALGAKILNRDVYKSDGTFVGRCTAVAHSSSSDGTITFGNGTYVALSDTNDLYVSGFGDKPPWVELYSTTVEKRDGTVKSLSDDTPAISGGGFTTWTASQNSDGTDDDYNNLIQNDSDTTYTSTNGIGATFNVKTDGSGNPTFYIASGGIGYAVNDTIRVDDPTNPSNKYSTLTIASINTKGLTLVDDGWMSQNDNETALAVTPKYLVNKDVNYVYNGDFANDDTDNGWTTEGYGLSLSQDTYASSSSSGDTPTHQYGGHDGTLQITEDGTTGDFYWHTSDSIPASYIHQTLTLDGGTWYHLNFLYTIGNGEPVSILVKPAFALYDDTLNQYITNWTICEDISLPLAGPVYYSSTIYNEYIAGLYSSPFHGNDSYKLYKDMPSGPFHRLNYSEEEGQVGKQIYHKFFVPKSNISQTSSISLRFSKEHSLNSTIHLAGITVHKAYNDLTTMSYADSGAANPFTGAIKNWSNYKLKFIVPESFSEVSDWKLKIHGGKYGWRSSNQWDADIAYAATENQEVYLDNISLTSPSSDLNAFDTVGTTTLLTSNRDSDSIIKMWNGSVWKTLATWGNKNSQPVYDYINGVLKISDANFDNNNENKLIYYDDENISNISSIGTWKQESTPLPSPPSPRLEYQEASALGGGFRFNACHYLNLLYKDLKWCTFPSTELGISNAQWTNWPLDEFADASYDSTGIGHIIRYICDERQGDGNEMSDHYFLNDWTYWSDKGCVAIPDPDNSNKQITSMGVSFVDHPTDEIGAIMNLNKINTSHWSDLSVKTSMSRFNCLIHAVGLPEPSPTFGKGIVEFINNENEELATSSSLARINYKIRWEAALDRLTTAKFVFSGYCTGGTSDGSESNDNACDYVGGVWHNVLQTRLLNNQRPPYFTVRAGAISDPDTPLNVIQDWGIDAGDLSMVRETVHGKSGNNRWSHGISVGREYGDNPCIITKYSESDSVENQAQVIVEILFEGSLTWNPGEIPMNTFSANDIVFQIEEDTATTYDYNTEHTHDSWQANFDGSSWDVSTLISVNPGTQGLTANDSNPNGLKRWRKHGTGRYPVYSRFFVDKIDVEFFDDEYEMPGSSEGEAIANFIWETPQEYLDRNPQIDETSAGFIVAGWGGRVFQMATTTVNKFDEESALSTPTNINTTFNLPSEDQAPSVEVFLLKSYYHDDFIKKTKFYLKDGESDIWYLQFWVDHKENKMYSSTSAIASDMKFNATPDLWGWNLDSINFKNYNEVNSYESETLVLQEDASNNSKLTCRYKTSVVCNNRMYVGNILQNGKRYGDRMLKSPIGKYNIFPASSFVDVAINDGDEITALAYYKDKLLQFKKKKVFVINVSGDLEFLDDTFHDVGVDGQFSVTTTKNGIAWANETGCYLYDGEKVENLIENKLPISLSYSNPANSVSEVNRWCANSSTGDCVIGYVRHKDTILINFTRSHSTVGATPTGATYHFPTKSWALIYGVWNSSSSSLKTGDMSNMITDTDGDILFYHTTSDNSAVERMNTIRKWVHESDSTLSTKNAYFVTKDITFGNINIKKKLYRIYITYRVRTDGTDSGMIVLGAVNGTGTFGVSFSQTSKFINTQTNCYAGGHLDETDADWKTAELKFDTPSEVNNITSFQLQIYSGSAAYDFEINDISISYKNKNVK